MILISKRKRLEKFVDWLEVAEEVIFLTVRNKKNSGNRRSLKNVVCRR